MRTLSSSGPRVLPVGSFNGALGTLPAHQLGAIAIKAALERAGVDSAAVSEVILGQVLTAAQGQNPARQASIGAGIPIESPAWEINMVCGSGLRTVALAAQAIQTGDSSIVVAGGQESMSMSAHAAHMRNGTRMGGLELVDTMIKDGLWDAFNGYHMGVNRRECGAPVPDHPPADQDEFAVALAEQGRGGPEGGQVQGRDRPRHHLHPQGDVVVDADEYIRHGATLDSMAKLKPAFSKDGTVTAGNASGINDGAAAIVLMSASRAAAEGKKPLARIVSWAQAGVDPSIMGTGPIPASKLALEKAGWSVGDLDLIEANEAFAAQAIAVNKGLGWDTDKVNVNGGAIAIGHPIGASGARILVTLLHEMERRDAKKGLATLCIGGGMGIALCVERD